MMRATSDVEPVSRILYGVAAADGHSSRPFIAERLKRPTRKLRRSTGVYRAHRPRGFCAGWGGKPAAEILTDSEESKDLSPWRLEQRRVKNGLRRPQLLPYLVLLRVGFAMPRALLRERCALTAPFHPYRFNSRAPQRLAPASPSRPVRAERLSPFGSPRSRTSQARRACACLAFASGSKANRLSPFTYVRRYVLCGTFRKVALKPPSRTLSGTLLCGVRTFLSLDRAARETPAFTTQTATIRSDINYPYYKMNLGRHRI